MLLAGIIFNNATPVTVTNLTDALKAFGTFRFTLATVSSSELTADE